MRAYIYSKYFCLSKTYILILLPIDLRYMINSFPKRFRSVITLASYFITSNSHQPLFSLHEAIRQNNIVKLKQHQKAETINHITGNILNLTLNKENNQSLIDSMNLEDVNFLSLSLQTIAKLTRMAQKHIISAQLYFNMLEKYYNKLTGLQNQQNNRKQQIINHESDISFLVNTFIYKENQLILQLIKMNQKRLLECLGKYRKIDHKMFMAIINTQIFNITDLPLINDTIYQHLYPRIKDLTTIKEIAQNVQYLSKFRCIPVILVQQSFQIVGRYLDSIIEHNSKMEIEDLFSITNIMYTLMYKATQTIRHKHGMARLYEIYQKLIQCSVLICKRVVLIQDLVNTPAVWQQLIEDHPNKEQILTSLASYKSQLLKMPLDSKSITDSCLQRQIKYLNLNNLQLKLKRVSSLHIRSHLLKFALLGVDLQLLPPSKYETIFNDQKNCQFVKANSCHSDLLKYLLLVTHKSRMGQNISFNKIIQTEIQQFRNTINFFIQKNLLKKANELNKFESNFPQLFKSVYSNLNQSKSLFSLRGHSLLQKIMEDDHQYGYSSINIIRLLKNDPFFLQSHIQWGQSKLLLHNIQQQQLKDIKYSSKIWEYPFYFESKLEKQKKILKVMVKNSFNKDQITPFSKSNQKIIAKQNILSLQMFILNFVKY